MSLASRLMYGNASNGFAVDTSEYVFEGITDDSYWASSACESLVTDIYDIDKAFHIADIMGEVKVIKEGADADVVLEGIVNNAIEKLKTAFKKFLAKIKEWLDQVIKFFKSLFMSGEKFVKEFGADLKDKEVKGFTYTGYDYDISAGDNLAKTARDVASNEIDICAAGIKGADKKARSYGDIGKKLGEDYKDKDSDKVSITTGDDFETSMFKKIGNGVTTMSELSEEIEKKYHKGEAAPDTIKDFSAASVSTMIDYIKGLKKQISDCEKEMRDFDTDVNKVIKALNDVKSSDGQAAYKVAQAYSKNATAALNVAKTASDAKIRMHKEIGTKYNSVLKSFYHWKPAKEGVEFDDDDDKKKCGSCESMSLFDAALELI